MGLADGAASAGKSLGPATGGILREVTLGVGHLLKHRLGAAAYRCCPHRNRPDGEPQHGGSLGSGGQRITGLGQGPVHTGQRPRDVEPVAGRPPLGLDADCTDTLQEPRQLIGDLHQFGVKLIVFHALKDLVIAVQSPVEAVMGAAPQALAELRIVLSPLTGGSKESHEEPRGTVRGRGPGPQDGPAWRRAAAPQWPAAALRSPR